MVRIGWLVLALLVGSTGCGGHSTGRNSAAAIATTPAVSSPAPAMPTLPASSPRTRTSTPGPRTSASSSSPASPKTPSTMPAAPPAAPAQVTARSVGLVDIRTVVPDAVVDLRYATANNFTGQRLYPVTARCLVHESMAPGLRVAADRLRREGYLLVFWDCYRPHPVQVRMFQIVPDPNWVARPGPYARSHEAGRSADVTLAYANPGSSCAAVARDHGHCLLDMGTGFDDFSSRAHAFATSGVSQQAQANRAVLRKAMNAGGITVYAGEWWHFDGPGAKVGRPHLNAPLD